MQELIEKLYQEIMIDDSKNTLSNNIDLFKEFYDNRNIIYWDFNEKVQTIVKYLLKYEEGEIFEYFYSNITSQLEEYFGKIHVKSMYKGEENISNIIKIINSLKLYNEIKRILQENKYAHKSNTMNCASTNKFCDDKITRNIIISLITQLSYNFLKVPNELILKSIYLIQNNAYIDKIIEKSELNLMDQEFIYKYINDYVNVVEFCTNNDMKNDKLINYLLKDKNSKTKDKQLIKKIIKEINKEQLEKLYDTDNLLDGLYDNLQTMNYSKDEINLIINENMEELLNNYPVKLLEAIVKDKYSYYNHILMTKIIKRCMTKQFEFYDNDIVIKYILENDILDTLQDSALLEKLFAYNLKEYNDISHKYTNLSSNNIPLIDIETREKLLEQHMKKEKQLNFNETMSIIKSIVKEESKNENVPIFLFVDDRLGGNYDPDRKSISINYEVIQNFINNPEEIELFNILYHELRHENQFYEIENGTGKEIFKKEFIVEKQNIMFYQENYKNVSYEKDARKAGFYKLILFLQKYKTKEEINKILNNMSTFEKDFDENNKRIIFNTKDISIEEIYEKLIYFKPELEEKQNQNIK